MQTTYLELTAINVALNAVAKDCNNKQLSNVILDGNKDPKMYVNVEGRCGGKRSVVEILLNGSYDVNYVVVYAGEGKKLTSLINCNIYFVYK